jgi:hypothetical protein
MAEVAATCGCWVEVEMDWDYGQCCGSDYPSSATILTTCDVHTPVDKPEKA